MDRVRSINVTEVKTNKSFVFLIDKDKKVSELKTQIQDHTRIPPIQQRIEHRFDIKGKNITELWKDDQRIDSVMKGEMKVFVNVKNLGPQLPYLTLFYMEYGVPMLIMPALYFFFGNKSNTAYFALIMGQLQFGKRMLESKFVHIFSNASVPVTGSYKNFYHYWLVYAMITSCDIFGLGQMNGEWDLCGLYYFAGICVFWQLCNTTCHVILRRLRFDDKGNFDRYARKIPQGCGFGTVVCANYFYEIMFWTTFTIATRSFASIFFTLQGTYIMIVWAGGKRKALLKTYEGDADSLKLIRRRKLVIPYVL